MSLVRRVAALTASSLLTACALVTFAPNLAAARAAPNQGPPCTSHANAEQPVICVPRGFRQEGGVQLTPGGRMTYFAQVVNRGPAVSDAVVDIELPPGSDIPSDQPVGRVDEQWWEPGSEPGPERRTCSPGAALVTCALGPLSQGANITIVVPVTIRRTAPTGVTRQLRVTLRPATSQQFDATAIRVPVRLVRPIHLEVSLEPKRPIVLLGVRSTIRVRIHNPGPDVARDSVVFAEDNWKRNTSSSVSPRFRYPDEPNPPPADPSISFLVPSAGQLNGVTSPDPNDDGEVYEDTQTLTFWRVPAIAPGATVTVPIRVKAFSVGTTEFHVAVLSTAGGACADKDRAAQCRRNALSVRALVLDRTLATTGTDVRVIVVFGALVFAAGATIHFSARRRRGAGDRQTSGSTR